MSRPRAEDVSALEALPGFHCIRQWNVHWFPGKSTVRIELWPGRPSVLNQYGEAPVLTYFKFPFPTVGEACAESWSSQLEDGAEPTLGPAKLGNVDQNDL